ncbi:MAG: hypothetical protein KKD73_11475 [Proteobacteria bacterium]|nr:hypothetical protein [Pseudomonadota bacterium]MBU1639916.1 hypothetical protein [Pseudomonadota bacterium]
MKRQELIASNPLRLLSPADGGMVAGRHLAVVKAPAGTGKTAILVQIALDKLLRGERVVHVGINDQLNSIKLWYSHVFAALASQVQLGDPAKLEDEIMGHRLLMTFMAENFTPARLAQRLDGLARHQIALPDCLVIDGLAGHTPDAVAMFAALQSYAMERNITIWLSCLEVCVEAEKLADTVLALTSSPDGHATLVVLKDEGGYAATGAAMGLDPQTLLLRR